ncbi:MAG: hypothetical protein D6679_06620 [Candidatus Hydrogenedentota bacterium]|nr:MAG: hypothetical protein D6679_06620 [Candidatus Hydrogenedentota bacterium]
MPAQTKKINHGRHGKRERQKSQKAKGKRKKGRRGTWERGHPARRDNRPVALSDCHSEVGAARRGIPQGCRSAQGAGYPVEGIPQSPCGDFRNDTEGVASRGRPNRTYKGEDAEGEGNYGETERKGKLTFREKTGFVR